MELSIVRIDDRLIHGQIVTKWIKYADAQQILVIDDKTAKDPMLKMILSLAVPAGINLMVLTKEDAITTLKNDKSSVKTLLIMRNPKEMLSLIDMGLSLQENEIIVGNISFDDKKANVKHVLDYIFVNDEDIADLKQLNSKTKSVVIKAVPEELGKSINDLFK